MNNKKLTGFGLRMGRNSLLGITAAALSFGCHKSNVDQKDLRDFTVVNLVANDAEYHPLQPIDPTLINGFGIAWSNGNPGVAWVNSVGGHVSELYRGDGTAPRGPVSIPSPTDDSTGGFPCGIVNSSGKGFTLPNGGKAAFLFSGFDGVISGWNGGNNALRVKAPAGASYTGLAIGASGGRNFIYAANFRQRKIDVWDTTFSRITTMAFKDPTLPFGFSPYNIQAVGDYLFVMYSKLDTVVNVGHGVNGLGLGFVSVFSMDGTFVKRFASRGSLNNPWGVTMAPGSFLEDKDMGDDGGDGHGGYESKSIISNNHGKHDPKDPVILVGNFGDGHVNVFGQDGQYLGQLLGGHKKPLEIEGLWALSFPPSTAGIDPARLYFSAGPDNENHGVFGYLIKQ